MRRRVGARGWTVAGGLLAAASAFAGTLSGSAHDFSAGLGGAGGGRSTCLVCHPAQQADGKSALLPVWDHRAPLSPFAIYSGLDLMGENRPIGSSSKICLSCHDGALARDSFGSMRVGGGFERSLAGDGAGPRPPADDHPIGLVYSNEGDPSLHSTDKRIVVGTGAGSREGTMGALLLRGGSLECTSCHDAHNTLAADGPGMVKLSTTGAAICLACHKK